ncbi:MAG: radical SAM protein [Cyanobacteria bacterium]|nr:radical SAM protein [Cyanobacteriota bacterium]
MNNNIKKEIIFAVPGSKTFISDYYKNTRGSFVNISITGTGCKLNCPHCKTHLLKDMDSVASPEILESFISSKIKSGKLNGVLISGGFDKNGKLPLKNYLNSIKIIKRKYPSLKIYAHVGFVDYAEAKEIKDSNIDGVLANVISSQNAIRSVYNLPHATPEDYYKTLKNLKKAEIRITPHIIIGLDFGKIESEYEAVRQVAKIGAYSLVFVVLKKLTKEIDFIDSGNVPLKKKNIDEKEIVSLISYARNLLPDTPITFGCAKPLTNKRGQLEIDLLNAGIDVIAFPSSESINYVISNKIPFRFEEICCANI